MKNSVDKITLDSKELFIEKWSSILRALFKENEYLTNFINNNDHWLEHSYNVFECAINIYNNFTDMKKKEINLWLVELMCVFHDIWRFHHQKCDRKHQKCWMAQARMYAKIVKISDEDKNKLIDFIKYHDFMAKYLDPDQREPNSIEWQIVRIADKMSIEPVHEIRRYWDYWKRIWATLFNKEITLEERLSFSFNKRWKLKTDQLTYFLALLWTSEDSITNEIIRTSYTEWSKYKHKAEEEIYKIMEEEWYKIEEIIKARTIVSAYKTFKHLKF